MLNSMSPRTTALLCVLVALGVFAAMSLRSAKTSGSQDALQTPGGKAKVVFQNVCATCHGPAGDGKLELKSPSIAGLPDWYVDSQLKKFHADIRGADPGDLSGGQMRAIAHILDASMIESIATLVSKMKIHPMQNTLGGDPQRGKESYQIHCEECHRYNASGEFAFKSPPLTGLQDWYLAAQLEKFRKRVRGGDPRDVEGAKMQIPSHRFLNAQDEKDVLAYIAYLANRK